MINRRLLSWQYVLMFVYCRSLIWKPARLLMTIWFCFFKSHTHTHTLYRLTNNIPSKADDLWTANTNFRRIELKKTTISTVRCYHLLSFNSFDILFYSFYYLYVLSRILHSGNHRTCAFPRDAKQQYNDAFVGDKRFDNSSSYLNEKALIMNNIQCSRLYDQCENVEARVNSWWWT